jgi:predicted transcriptional regulator
MKKRTITVRIESDDTFFDRARAIAKRIDKGEIRDYGEHLSFATYEQFTSAFSEKRYDLLRRLKAHGPCSIRALSKDLTRDYKSVHGDVKKLLELGLIEKRNDGLIEAPYDTIVSEISLKAA